MSGAVLPEAGAAPCLRAVAETLPGAFWALWFAFLRGGMAGCLLFLGLGLLRLGLPLSRGGTRRAALPAACRGHRR